MSYDLFLRSEDNSFDATSFEQYFSQRAHYNVQGSQAWYQNEATGVYFLFELQGEDDSEAGEDFYPVAFNMNYFRPTYFVLEAEPEVTAFIKRFSMTVMDPQMEGMGTGDYSAERFKTGWLHGNDFGYSSILKNHQDVYSLPQAQLHQLWEWNFNKEDLQGSVEDDVFVPKIMLVKRNGIPITAAVWPDAIPSVLPEVDYLLIGRQELAPRRLFKKQDDMVVVAFSEMRELIDKYKTKMHGSAYYLFYESVPDEIKKAIQRFSPHNDELEGLPVDQVLDREIVEKYFHDN
ncbi:MAG: hypothetical protein QNI98_05860 [Woeseiaceae bacterium]|nr:hypothetical protein [Woeseiaceae bacterium]